MKTSVFANARSGANSCQFRMALSWHVPCANLDPSEVPDMPSPSDQGGRPVTPCPKCRSAAVKALAHASNFVYLRCDACAFLFVIENRRSGTRSEEQDRIIRRWLRTL